MLEITEFVDQQIWYAPDIQDNRERPEDRQFKVLLEPMTKRELRKAEEALTNVSRHKAHKINITARYNKIREQIILRCVKEIKNLFYVEVSNGTRKRIPIGDNKTFIDHVNEQILEDIYDALKDHSLLDEGLVKNFEAPSCSTDLRPTRNVDGDVANATILSTEINYRT